MLFTVSPFGSTTQSTPSRLAGLCLLFLWSLLHDLLQLWVKMFIHVVEIHQIKITHALLITLIYSFGIFDNLISWHFSTVVLSFAFPLCVTCCLGGCCRGVRVGLVGVSRSAPQPADGTSSGCAGSPGPRLNYRCDTRFIRRKYWLFRIYSMNCLISCVPPHPPLFFPRCHTCSADSARGASGGPGKPRAGITTHHIQCHVHRNTNKHNSAAARG